MTEPANLELAIALPLGVVANQLTRIEAELRFLSMKASAYRNEPHSGELAARVSGSLEKINEALDLIKGVVADMETGLQAASTGGKALRDRGSRKSDRDD
jgi:hypothetical protein